MKNVGQKLRDARARMASLVTREKELREKADVLHSKAIDEKRKLTAAESADLKAIDADIAGVAEEKETVQASISNLDAQEKLDRDVPLLEDVHDAAADCPWGAKPEVAFGEFMSSVRKAATPGEKFDPRLVKAGPSGGSTGGAGDAGFIVQKDQSMMLMNKVQESSKLLPLCDTIEISENADSLEAPYVRETSRADGSRWGGVQVYRRKEAATVTESKPDMGLFELRLEDLMAISYQTGRQLQDARASGQILSRAYASETAFRIDREIYRGGGAGEMTGVMGAACTVTVSKEATQAADTIIQKNLSKMYARVHPDSRGKMVVVINAECEPALDELYVPAGTSGLEPRFITYDASGVIRFKGRPIVVLEQASALGDLGDIAMLDLSQYCVIRKGGTQEDTSIHVRFLYDEQAFRFITRINGKPKWESALTPYKGSATLSPFVILQAR